MGSTVRIDPFGIVSPPENRRPPPPQRIAWLKIGWHYVYDFVAPLALPCAI